MARSFTRNLVAFTIGRDNNIHDMKTVDAILAKTAPNGYRAGDILAEILSRYFKICKDCTPTFPRPSASRKPGLRKQFTSSNDKLIKD